MPPNPLKRDSSNISISFPRFIFFFNTFKILTNKSFNVRDKLICTRCTITFYTFTKLKQRHESRKRKQFIPISFIFKYIVSS